MKQTATEWVLDWMGKNQYFIGNDLLQAVSKAKAMEKQQIIDAYRDGRSDQQSERQSRFYNRMAEQYYQQTFKSE